MDGGRDISYWRDLARAMSLEEFAEDHPHPFLLRKRLAHTAPVLVAAQPPAGDFEEDLQYNTDVVDVERIPHRSVGRIAGAKVVPILKSDRNPFSGQISVGRAKNCDIILREQTVSKHHAYFRVLDASTAEIVDMGSQNSTRVNGEPVAAKQARSLQNGDTITFGSVACLFVDAHGLYRML